MRAGGLGRALEVEKGPLSWLRGNTEHMFSSPKLLGRYELEGGNFEIKVGQLRAEGEFKEQSPQLCFYNFRTCLGILLEHIPRVGVSG